MEKRVKVKKIKPRLDKDEFFSLTDLLFVTLKENKTLCAKVLGIDTRTWDKWTRKAPKWPWWNVVLREVVKVSITATLSKGGVTKMHKRRMITALARIPQADDMEAVIMDMVYRVTGAESVLRSLLTPGGMYFDEIMIPVNAQGFSPRSFRLAASKLKVVKKQTGAGKTHRSFWRLPEAEDYNDGNIE